MTRDETIQVLRARRALTGQVYDDSTIDAWNEAFDAWAASQVHAAVIAAALTHQSVNVAHVVENLPRTTTSKRDSHSVHCVCGGSGWLLVTQHDEHHTWKAWSRCPDGPSTSFIVHDDDYDPTAGAAAHATYQALAAKAETRADLANACFAAAAAYRNTIEQRTQ